MDPNETLRQIRALIQDVRTLKDDPEDVARVLADRVEALDSWLRQGGFPPEAWREGPDEHPEHIYVPEAPSDDPYCATHGRRFAPEIGCPECLGYGVCLTCGAPCDGDGCTADDDHLAAVDRPIIPADIPVRPLEDGDEPAGWARDLACGLAWDDSISTSYTPAPAGRCPFEAFHTN